GGRRDAPAVRGLEAIAVHVRHQAQTLVAAYRTCARGFTEVARHAQQLRMGVAHFESFDVPRSKVAQHGSTSEGVVDVPAHGWRLLLTKPRGSEAGTPPTGAARATERARGGGGVADRPSRSPSRRGRPSDLAPGCRRRQEGRAMPRTAGGPTMVIADISLRYIGAYSRDDHAGSRGSRPPQGPAAPRLRVEEAARRHPRLLVGRLLRLAVSVAPPARARRRNRERDPGGAVDARHWFARWRARVR